MKRSMMQAYVKGSKEAVPFYLEVFNGELISSYINEDGGNQTVTGNTMQFCLHYGEGREETIRDVYEKLKQNAQIRIPLEPCSFSELMADLTDQFGVRWCLFL